MCDLLSHKIIFSKINPSHYQYLQKYQKQSFIDVLVKILVFKLLFLIRLQVYVVWDFLLFISFLLLGLFSYAPIYYMCDD